MEGLMIGRNLQTNRRARKILPTPNKTSGSVMAKPLCAGYL
jgi:hypothetical protein